MSASCCSTPSLSAHVGHTTDVNVTQHSARPTDQGATVPAVQAQTIVVNGGYSPAHLNLKKDIPARLSFERHEAIGCSAALVIPALGIQQALAPNGTTVVEFTPTVSGTFVYHCGMKMLTGTLVVA